MRIELLGYVSNWRADADACQAYVTTLGEHDFRLWAPATVAEPYRPQWLRLQGLAIGSWLVATHIAPGPSGGGGSV